MPRAPALPLPPDPATRGPAPPQGGRPPRLDAARTNLALPRTAKRRAMAEARRRGVTLAAVIAECIEAMLGEGRAA